jgi:O-antigen ligase
VNTWRSSGTLGPPNAFGAYLLTLVPFAVRAVFYLPIKPKWLWGIVLLLSTASLFSSYVRGAWLAFIISILLFFLVDMSKSKLPARKKFTFIVIVVLFGIGMSVKYGDEIVNRMADSEESMMGDAKHSRKSMALDALRIIDEHPLLGVGINNYRYYADKQTGGTRIVHNAYLLITAEQGMVSGILFVVVHLSILIVGMRLLRSPSPFYYQVGASALSSMLGICIYHMVAPDYRLTGVIIQHWRIVGMVLGLVVADELYRRRLRAARPKPKWSTPGLGRFPKQNPTVMMRTKAY